MARQFAVRLALVAFAASLAAGLCESLDFSGAVTSALAHAAAFFGLGWICGELASRVVEENARQEVARRLKELEPPAPRPA
jgi:hypothetical protein